MELMSQILYQSGKDLRKITVTLKILDCSIPCVTTRSGSHNLNLQIELKFEIKIQCGSIVSENKTKNLVRIEDYMTITRLFFDKAFV